MAECGTCKEHAAKPENVPYLVYESSQARHERTTKRLICVLLIVIFLWACTIGGFMWHLNQYDFTNYEYSQDGEGVNIMGNENGVDYNVPETENTP